MKYYINFQLFKEGFFDEIHNVSLYKKNNQYSKTLNI